MPDTALRLLPLLSLLQGALEVDFTLHDPPGLAEEIRRVGERFNRAVA